MGWPSAAGRLRNGPHGVDIELRLTPKWYILDLCVCIESIDCLCIIVCVRDVYICDVCVKTCLCMVCGRDVYVIV